MAHPVNRMRAVHPGEVLREDFLAPLGLSVNAHYDLKTLPTRRAIERQVLAREVLAAKAVKPHPSITSGHAV